jgi:hypothetical protein
MEQDHERRYAIKPDEGYFCAGVTADSKQVLMGLFCPNLVAFDFDLEGNLLRVDQRPVPFFQGVTPPYNIYDERIPPLIESWKKEMGFRPATIRVKRFFSAEHSIGIEDYPAHFHEILSDPAAGDEEKADIHDSMELWDKDGQFVLLWGNDYWLDGSGRVVSS